MESVQILNSKHFTDHRGAFVKTFHATELLELGITFEMKESYYSISKKNVIRGMHFQLPPHQHAKIVFCPYGAILDVAIDLRKDSPHYGTCFSTELSAENHKAFYIPEGFAHGFKSLTEGAITQYFVSSVYHANADTGIAYNSIDFDWGITNALLSERDQSFVKFENFKSPF